jgi:hypothetical protein
VSVTEKRRCKHCGNEAQVHKVYVAEVGKHIDVIDCPRCDKPPPREP